MPVPDSVWLGSWPACLWVASMAHTLHTVSVQMQIEKNDQQGEVSTV